VCRDEGRDAIAFIARHVVVRADPVCATEDNTNSREIPHREARHAYVVYCPKHFTVGVEIGNPDAIEAKVLTAIGGTSKTGQNGLIEVLDTSCLCTACDAAVVLVDHRQSTAAKDSVPFPRSIRFVELAHSSRWHAVIVPVSTWRRRLMLVVSNAKTKPPQC
jgi:hypothetical protein